MNKDICFLALLCCGTGFIYGVRDLNMPKLKDGIHGIDGADLKTEMARICNPCQLSFALQIESKSWRGFAIRAPYLSPGKYCNSRN